MHYHYGYGGYGGYGRSTSALGIVLAVIAILVIIGFVMLFAVDNNTIKSTIEREPIKPVNSFAGDCLIDNLNWIMDKKTVLAGMHKFYSETGVQPYLYIDDNVHGDKHVSERDLHNFAEELYNEYAAPNEQCIILLFFEWKDSDVTTYYIAGKGAQSVMDDEACDILLDYTEGLYTSDLSDEEYFSAIFVKTANRIMSVSPTLASRIPLMIGGVVVCALIVAIVVLVNMKHKRDKEKAEETERILHTPVDRL